MKENKTSLSEIAMSIIVPLCLTRHNVSASIHKEIFQCQKENKRQKSITQEINDGSIVTSIDQKD
jgi:hypothetical protein